MCVCMSLLFCCFLNREYLSLVVLVDVLNTILLEDIWWRSLRSARGMRRSQRGCEMLSPIHITATLMTSACLTSNTWRRKQAKEERVNWVVVFCILLLATKYSGSGVNGPRSCLLTNMYKFRLFVDPPLVEPGKFCSLLYTLELIRIWLTNVILGFILCVFCCILLVISDCGPLKDVVGIWFSSEIRTFLMMGNWWYWQGSIGNRKWICSGEGHRNFWFSYIVDVDDSFDHLLCLWHHCTWLTLTR